MKEGPASRMDLATKSRMAWTASSRVLFGLVNCRAISAALVSFLRVRQHGVVQVLEIGAQIAHVIKHTGAIDPSRRKLRFRWHCFRIFRLPYPGACRPAVRAPFTDQACLAADLVLDFERNPAPINANDLLLHFIRQLERLNPRDERLAFGW